MQVVRFRVPAKINLVLRVGPLRSDGFHDLATVFHAVSLYDEVSVTDGDGVSLAVDGTYRAGVPRDGSNLAVRAVRALANAAGVPARAVLHVRKEIPVAAGLAGGSADAVGALLACNQLWGLSWPVERLSGVAATLGSDVPFALVGATAVGTGRGERLEQVTVSAELHWVLAIADGELSTPAVYRRLDELRATAASPAAGGPVVDPRVLTALERGSTEDLAALLANDLQAAAVDLQPSLGETLRAGRDAGALGGIVSGSGPTCMFLARDATHARAVAGQLNSSGSCCTAETVTGSVAPRS